METTFENWPNIANELDDLDIEKFEFELEELEVEDLTVELEELEVEGFDFTSSTSTTTAPTTGHDEAALADVPQMP